MAEKLDPVYAYIDSQIRPLKLELLRTQRHFAHATLVSVYNDCQERLLRSRRDVDQSLSRQMLTEATAAATKVNTSLDPIAISKAFGDKWYDKLDELGIKFVTFS